MKLFNACAAMVLALAVVAVAGEDKVKADKPWFDLENCSFCREFSKQPGLLEHSHSEYHNLKNGVISVFYVDPGFDDELAAAMTGMNAVAANMGPDKPMPAMCEHCAVYGGLRSNPLVQMEDIQSGDRYISVMTSSDAATVAQLQAFGKKNNEEQKKFEESMKKRGEK